MKFFSILTLTALLVCANATPIGPLSPEKDPHSSLKESIRQMKLSLDRELVYLARADEIAATTNVDGLVARQGVPVDGETDDNMHGFTDKVNDGSQQFRPIRPGSDVPSARQFDVEESASPPEPSPSASFTPVVSSVESEPVFPSEMPSISISATPFGSSFPSVSAIPTISATPIGSSFPSFSAIPTDAFITTIPSDSPTASIAPSSSFAPSISPSADPTVDVSTEPSTSPSANPTVDVSTEPSTSPSANPTVDVSTEPSTSPSANPTVDVSTEPSTSPSANPTVDVSTEPSITPISVPSPSSSAAPSEGFSVSPEPTIISTASVSAITSASAAPTSASAAPTASTSSVSTTSAFPSSTPTVTASPSVSASPSEGSSTDMISDGPAETPEPDNVCFPGHVTVQMQDGSVKQMNEVQLGDRVLVEGGKYSEVFMFTHKMADVRYRFVHLTTDIGAKLALTSGHYIYVNGHLAAAATVKQGDSLMLADSTLTKVTAVDSVMSTGLFNPQTVHGDIIVNGLRASTYTTTVRPNTAHALLAPLRAVYERIGLSLSSFELGGGFLAGLVPSGSAVH